MVTMLLKLEGVTGAFSRGDISLPTSYLTPKLPFFGTGLRARELKVLVGTLLTGGGALVVVVVLVVVDVVVVEGVVVGVVVSLKLTRGILIGDLRDGYFVEYFFIGLTVVMTGLLKKLLLSNIFASPSDKGNVWVTGGGLIFSNIVGKLGPILGFR